MGRSPDYIPVCRKNCPHYYTLTANQDKVFREYCIENNINMADCMRLALGRLIGPSFREGA